MGVPVYISPVFVLYLFIYLSGIQKLKKKNDTGNFLNRNM